MMSESEIKKTVLTGLLPEEICSVLALKQQFRGLQIFKWISSGADSFDTMTNISKCDRVSFSEKACLRSSSVSQILRDDDGTLKMQITLHDGRAVETVLLTDSAERKTACVSCQAGCAMKCAFCKTGSLGFARNLSAAEIIEQFLFLEKECGKLDNIVFMGMGEPLLNIDAIRKAISILTDKRGRALSSRRITLSTCGIIKGIYDLADNGPLVRLAVSLTTADETLRNELMPIARENPLNELKKAIRYYTEKSGKRVTLEAALLAGKNTSEKSADNLIHFASNLNVNINVIAWNPVENLPFEKPSSNEVARFVSMLEKAALNVTVRKKRGQNIGGACGQLGKTEPASDAEPRILTLTRK